RQLRHRVHHGPVPARLTEHGDLGRRGSGPRDVHRDRRRAGRRPLAVREVREGAGLPADGHLDGRRVDHLGLRLRVPPRPAGRQPDRPAQPGARVARAPAAAVPHRPAVEHVRPHRRHDLDPDRVRDDDPLGRDQGDPRRHRRGGAARRAQGLRHVPLHHDPERAPGPRRRPHDDRDGDAQDLRHRADHDGRPVRHPGRGERVLHAGVPAEQPGPELRARGDPVRARHPDHRLQRPADASRGGDPMTSTPIPPVVPDTDLTTEAELEGPSRPRKLTRLEKRAIAAKGKLSSPWASFLAILIALLWTIPSVGLLVTSFRPELDIRRSGWWTVIPGIFTGEAEFTLDNYDQALYGSGSNLSTYFVNSFVITLPAVVIPITLALLAAYAFAWIEFKGREILFVAIFALQVVPLQVALVPLLRDYVTVGLNGTFWTVWLSHSIFALPLAIFLLHNFMKDIPRSLVEAARVDGAGHVKIFFQVLLPLLVPAIASFAIFQFLWVWNDLLVGLTFANTSSYPLTVRVAEMAGSRGGDWHILTAGAFISIIVPLIVFVALQRYFVRGLLAGSVKG